MPDVNHTIVCQSAPVPGGKTRGNGRQAALKRSIARLARSGLGRCLTAGVVGAATLLLCQCNRQPPTPTPTATPAATETPSPTVSATAAPVETPTSTPVPTISASPLLPPTATATPDAFEEGMKQLFQASGNGFLDMRGKIKKTENGSGADPLFRVRKMYEGTFLFGGATSAELEEVYYGPGPQPAYNYHLYYETRSSQGSIAKYDDLLQNLNRVLPGFEHTFGDRYDAWARIDPLKTAILLNSQNAGGAPEVQVHVAFASPRW